MLVKPEVASKQLAAEVSPSSGAQIGKPSNPATKETKTAGGNQGDEPPVQKPAPPNRFFGAVRLDPMRVGRDASKIADEVIAHLVGQLGADVKVTLEIDATLPVGATDQIVRIVTENSRTLKFDSHSGFARD